MKKYKRISCSFIPDGAFGSLKSDEEVSEALNKKLNAFLKAEKVKSYQIINTETVLVPSHNFTTPYNLVCMHIVYEV